MFQRLGAAARPRGISNLSFRLPEDIIAGLMPNIDEPQTVFQEILGFEKDRSAFAGQFSAAKPRRPGFWSHFLSHEWSSAALYLFLDVVSWLAIYRVAGWAWDGAIYDTPFQLFVI